MTEAKQNLGKNAIVIGGSMSGMLTARVLSEHFEQVTIVERDAFSDDPEPRKGVPQGNHVHVMFSGGMRVIDRLFPGFSEELANNGSVVCDFANDLCWYHAGVWKSRQKSDLKSYWQTRPFLETYLRQRLRRDTDIRILKECAVVGLKANPDSTRITGVEIRHGQGDGKTETLEADLVVDASGRGSQTPKWLESLGYEAPAEKTVEVNIGYASRAFEPSEDASRDWQIMAQYGTPPGSTRTGYIFPVEGGRWLVSLVGFLKDYPPDDDEEYFAYAKSFEQPDFYEAIKDAQPLTPIATFKFPCNRWRRYESLSRFPSGLLAIGDAISTFNPVYGQGMSASALQVDQLRRLLEQYSNNGGIPEDLHKAFFRRTAKIIGIPWMLATQSDFLYPSTRGKRPIHTNALNWYLIHVLKLCGCDERITKTFYEVLHFNKKPTAFFHPTVMFAVLMRCIGLKGSRRTPTQRPSLAE